VWPQWKQDSASSSMAALQEGQFMVARGVLATVFECG